MEIQMREEGKVQILGCQGRMDAQVSDLLKERIQELLDKGAKELVLDLEGLEFLDSSGLGALVACLRRIKEKKGELDRAAEDFHAAVTLRRKDPDCYFSYARVLGKQGDKKVMYEVLQMVVELDPANAQVLKKHEDFKAYRDDPEFKKLVGGAAGEK